MRLAPILLPLVWCTAAARDFPFRLATPAEVVATIEPPAGTPDGAPIEVALDGSAAQQVRAFRGARLSVLLGRVPAGEHRLSAGAARAEFSEYRPGSPDYDIVANAPFLYARPDTVGRMSDMPLVVYCERLVENGVPALQYTVMYSNEDGGTSTRALMARWGRTTDIDWAVKVFRDGRATYQAKDHKELPFRGHREASHPVLYVATDNNMVSDRGEPTLRIQLAPVAVDLTDRSRESVMDMFPWTYRVAAEELAREGKLRSYGAVEGEKISDPRNYVAVEIKVVNEGTAVAALLRLEGSDTWRSSDLGRLDFAIPRSGVVRTTVEMPPGTQPEQIAEAGIACLLVPDERGNWHDAPGCRVERVTAAGAPTPWTPVMIAPGEVRRQRVARSNHRYIRRNAQPVITTAAQPATRHSRSTGAVATSFGVPAI